MYSSGFLAQGKFFYFFAHFVSDKVSPFAKEVQKIRCTREKLGKKVLGVYKKYITLLCESIHNKRLLQ